MKRLQSLLQRWLTPKRKPPVLEALEEIAVGYEYPAGFLSLEIAREEQLKLARALMYAYGAYMAKCGVLTQQRSQNEAFDGEYKLFKIPENSLFEYLNAGEIAALQKS